MQGKAFPHPFFLSLSLLIVDRPVVASVLQLSSWRKRERRQARELFSRFLVFPFWRSRAKRLPSLCSILVLLLLLPRHPLVIDTRTRASLIRFSLRNKPEKANDEEGAVAPGKPFSLSLSMGVCLFLLSQAIQ